MVVVSACLVEDGGCGGIVVREEGVAVPCSSAGGVEYGCLPHQDSSGPDAARENSHHVTIVVDRQLEAFVCM